mgnify:CR=1 FL=1
MLNCYCISEKKNDRFNRFATINELPLQNATVNETIGV